MSTLNSRSQKRSGDKRRLAPLTIQILPAVKAELQRIAEQGHLSLSTVSRTGLEDWVQQSLHVQHEALLYPVIRQIIREELRSFGNRIVFFLMRIAFAGEQSRILVTNVLDRVLRREGVTPDTFTSFVDKSGKMARRNIIQKTPQIKSLLEEWESSFQDSPEEGSGRRDG